MELTARQHIFDLVEGDSPKATLYGKVMAVVIVASLIPLCFKHMNAAFYAIEAVCVTIFIVDYAMRWFTADMKLGKGAASFLLYPFTPMAIVDLLSILPAFLIMNPAFKAFRLLRLMLVLRAFKLLRYSKGLGLVVAVFTKQRNALLLVLAFVFVYVTVCALVMFNVEPDMFGNFIDALYWAVISLLTIGYGDLTPTTELGRIVTMASSLVGVAVIALPSGIITAGILDELRERRAAGQDSGCADDEGESR